MKSRVDNKYQDVQHLCDAIIPRVDRLKKELKIVEEEKVKCEGKMAITLAGKVETDKLYCEAELKRKDTEVGVREAQVNIEKWQRHYNESVDIVNFTKEKLSHLTM
ncbi:hypothetical protein CTI12_AA212100 [Artemisia annua]|uniref:Uncharacterized protein n=1 Tax=Artemisia annua TaxID=35608 RepID=A0A2U1NZ51_ARTAN|nr:hypothetical protein CTI12_AA212100 [Artemisia annua]